MDGVYTKNGKPVHPSRRYVTEDGEDYRLFRRLHVEAGTWEPVLARYNALREKGLYHRDRFEVLLREFPIEGFVRMVDRKRKKGGGAVVPEKSSEPGGVPGVDVPSVPVERKSSGSATKRTISDVEMMRWVYEHMGDEGVQKDDAPTPGTWELLQDCKDNPATRRDFRNAWMREVLKRDDAQVSDADARADRRIESRLLEFEQAG